MHNKEVTQRKRHDIVMLIQNFYYWLGTTKSLHDYTYIVRNIPVHIIVFINEETFQTCVYNNCVYLIQHNTTLIAYTQKSSRSSYNKHNSKSVFINEDMFQTCVYNNCVYLIHHNTTLIAYMYYSNEIDPLLELCCKSYE